VSQDASGPSNPFSDSYLDAHPLLALRYTTLIRELAESQSRHAKLESDIEVSNRLTGEANRERQRCEKQYRESKKEIGALRLHRAEAKARAEEGLMANTQLALANEHLKAELISANRRLGAAEEELAVLQNSVAVYKDRLTQVCMLPAVVSKR
jgi:chromosome segregation ATPase